VLSLLHLHAPFSSSKTPAARRAERINSTCGRMPPFDPCSTDPASRIASAPELWLTFRGSAVGLLRDEKGEPQVEPDGQHPDRSASRGVRRRHRPPPRGGCCGCTYPKPQEHAVVPARAIPRAPATPGPARTMSFSSLWPRTAGPSPTTSWCRRYRRFVRSSPRLLSARRRRDDLMQEGMLVCPRRFATIARARIELPRLRRALHHAQIIPR